MIEHQPMTPARARVARSLPWLLVPLGISLVLLGVSLYLRGRTGGEYNFLYRDANSLEGNSFCYGMIESPTAVLIVATSVALKKCQSFLGKNSLSLLQAYEQRVFAGRIIRNFIRLMRDICWKGRAFPARPG